MPVDAYWERIRLASQLIHDLRSRRFRSEGLTGEEEFQQELANFDPGEIAFAPGGINTAYYDFLEADGYILDTEERLHKEALATREAGRYCLVLQRLGPEQGYLVAYLTTWRNYAMRIGSRGETNLTLMQQFCGLAMGNTPEWPPGVPSLKTNPRWRGGGYVYCLPVVRRHLYHQKSDMRFILADGELRRLQWIVKEAVTNVRANMRELRTQQLQMRRAYLDGVNIMAAIQRAASEAPITATVQEIDKFQREREELQHAPVVAKEKQEMKSKAPKIKFYPGRQDVHWLELPREQINLRWSLKWLREDLVHWSPYLNKIAPRIPRDDDLITWRKPYPALAMRPSLRRKWLQQRWMPLVSKVLKRTLRLG